MKRIAIVGGGSCGVAVFIELSLKIYTNGLEGKVSILWFEKDSELGYGLAFGTKEEGHLLNTQSDLMGIYVDEEDDFANWLKKKGNQVHDLLEGDGDIEDRYTHRRLYGDYLSEQAKRYLDLAKSRGLKARVIHKEIQKIKHIEEEYTLIDSSGKKYKADYIVLALGTPKPNNFEEFQGNERYVDFPWPTKRLLDKAVGTDTVGILGTSLSAIDTVMTLADNGYKGKIQLYSPNGLLPKVQPVEEADPERYHLTLENLHRWQRLHLQKPTARLVYNLFRLDVERLVGKVEWKKQDRVGQSAKRLLGEDIRMAEAGGDPLMKVAYALRHDTTPIWKMMSPNERTGFMKKWGDLWAINRHGMPLPNAYKLRKLMNADNLRIYSHLENVQFLKNEECFELTTKDKKYQVDILVNATGSATDLKDMNSPLIDYLLKKRMIVRHPLNGAMANPTTMQLIAPMAGHRIYALGHILNGTLLDHNAVWFNVQTAGQLVEHLFWQLNEESDL